MVIVLNRTDHFVWKFQRVFQRSPFEDVTCELKQIGFRHVVNEDNKIWTFVAIVRKKNYFIPSDLWRIKNFVDMCLLMPSFDTERQMPYVAVNKVYTNFVLFAQIFSPLQINIVKRRIRVEKLQFLNFAFWYSWELEKVSLGFESFPIQKIRILYPRASN